MPDNILFREGMKNVEEAAEDFSKLLKKRVTHYRSQKHIMVLYGHDFHFTNAENTYELLDKTISLVNKNNKKLFYVKYSTPSEYFREIREEKSIFPSFGPDNDFLPYQAGVVNWWTGFFTSRPNFKRTCRQNDNLLRNAEFLFSFASIFSNFTEKSSLYNFLEDARRVNAIKTHHDAITGTSREVVLLDYEDMISSANSNLGHVIQNSLKSLSNDQNLKTIEIGKSFIILIRFLF